MGNNIASKFLDSHQYKVSELYRATKTNKIHTIKRVLSQDVDVNTKLKSTGRKAGYTLLHVACVKNNLDLVKLLIHDYKADVNAIAGDGVQPIHLASILGHQELAHMLLKAGADANADFGYKIFAKYCKDRMWVDDFGDKMTILSFAVLNDLTSLVHSLVTFNADVKVKSVNNKTLLMYAVENSNKKISRFILSKSNEDWINARDNDGRHVLHYLLPDDKFGEFRYDEKQWNLARQKYKILKALVGAGADISATINGDPDTLLLNIAAYRSCCEILETLLPRTICIDKSKALFNSLLPVDNQKYCRRYQEYQNIDIKSVIRRERRQCAGIVVRDLLSRRAFGLPVPENEIKLIDQLSNVNTDFRKVSTSEKCFFEMMQKTCMRFSDGVRVFEVSMENFNEVIKDLVNSEQFLQKLALMTHSLLKHPVDYHTCRLTNRYFLVLLKLRVDDIRKKRALLGECQNIPHLRKFIPLPFEVVLDIFDLVSTRDVENFIKAFYSTD